MAVKKKRVVKKYHKPHQLRHIYRDKKGHIVERVSTRPNQYTGLKVRPYFYCPKCDLFFAEKMEKMILIG